MIIDPIASQVLYRMALAAEYAGYRSLYLDSNGWKFFSEGLKMPHDEIRTEILQLREAHKGK